MDVNGAEHGSDKAGQADEQNEGQQFEFYEDDGVVSSSAPPLTNGTVFNLGESSSDLSLSSGDDMSISLHSTSDPSGDSGIRKSMSASSQISSNGNAANSKKYVGDRRESGTGCGAMNPEEFVRLFGGTTVINKILIANNGIAAVKCMRSIRRWAYEMFRNDRAIKFVAMVTPEDLHASAEYIRMADQFIMTSGGSNNNNYANVQVILELAQKMEVQAVWAGWGHASENPKLPELLNKHDIIFIGPPAKAMWSLGDKIASSIVAQTAKVPTLPWSGSGLTIPWKRSENVSNGSLYVPPSLYAQATVSTVEEGIKIASRIGLPLMIKASEGGGGKGIRKCVNMDEFPTQFRQVQAEVPGSPIFIMKLATGARHLEVQLLADCYGNAVSLFGRDCSIQRRHQKIIEEAPTSVAPSELFEQMEKDAVKLAKMVGYVSAGTVEYLYLPETQRYYFLELNPRLQVEHPCTEMVANVNLPAAQLQIAMGIPLHRIKDIRNLYGASPFGDTSLNFECSIHRPLPRGHVIAARITSENPDDGFLPSSGTVQELNFRSSKNAWGYFSVSTAGGLHEFADSQFGHCFSWGETRDDAIANMVLALKELSIRGDFRTTVEYLITLLETDDFIRDQFDTQWLDQLIGENVKTEKPDVLVGVVCLSVLLADVTIVNAFQSFQNSLDRGQVLPAKWLIDSVDVELTHEDVRYAVEVTRCCPQAYFLVMNGSGVEVEFHRMSDGGMLLSYNSNSYTCYMNEEVHQYRVIIGNNKTIEFQKKYNPTEIRSPSAGKLVQYLVEDGDHVCACGPVAEIEVMKMIITLSSPANGSIHYVKRPGALLNPGSLVATLTLDDPSRVRRIVDYDGTFPVDLPSAQQHGEKLYQTYRDLVTYFDHLLQGYTLPEPYFSANLRDKVDKFFRVLKDPRLPLYELQESMAVISGRIPIEVESQISQLMLAYAGNITSVLCKFPSQQIAQELDNEMAKLSKKQDREMFFMSTHGLLTLVQRYRDGIRGHMVLILRDLFRRYLNTEKHFEQHQYDECVHALRENLKNSDRRLVTDAIFSHRQLAKKNQAIVMLIEHVGANEPGVIDDLKDVLGELTTLSKADHGKVALLARQLLIAAHQPSYDTRHNQVESIFLSALDRFGQTFQPENLYKLITSETSICDVLHDFFYHPHSTVRKAALEVYVRRTYVAFEVNCLKHHSLVNCPSCSAVEYQFTLPSSHPERMVITSSSKCCRRRRRRRSRTATTTALSSNRIHQMCRICNVDDDDDDDYYYYYSVGLDLPDSPNCQRIGILAAFENFEMAVVNFDQLLNLFTLKLSLDPVVVDDRETNTVESSSQSVLTKQQTDQPIRILNIAVKIDSEPKADDASLAEKFQNFCTRNKSLLVDHGIRRITFITLTSRTAPKYYTFRSKDHFEEDRIYRHLDPAMAFQLEIGRMKNFTLEAVPTANSKLHLYLGKGKLNNERRELSDYRFFLRYIIRHSDLISKEASFEYMRNEGERVLLESLDELEVAFNSHPDAKRCDCNHIFLNFMPCVTLDPQKVVDTVSDIIIRYGQRLWNLRVLEAELKYSIRLVAHGPPIIMRLTICNQSGYYLNLQLYQEVVDNDSGQVRYKSWNSDTPGPLDNLAVSTPYQAKDHMQQKRYSAQKMGTTYVYDYPEMFRQALLKLWRERNAEFGYEDEPTSVEVLQGVELALDSRTGDLVEVNRIPGENTCGMVVWRLTLKTPEYVNGRDIILIANDMTHLIGSFGVEEDQLFYQASRLSRQLKIPRIYVAANSGARIGLSAEVRRLFRIAWEDVDDPDKGFKYFYLTPDDYNNLNAAGQRHVVNAQPIVVEGDEIRYKIVDIIGTDRESIGVENLRGSGLIAGETTQAYDEVCVISLVSCRTVGIGAYLVRLGQRTIQVDNSHIILTGAPALNKLLGREVYSSNNQLGGTQIMHNNGVSHAIAQNEFDGVYLILKWLSYIPSYRGGPLPIVSPTDPVEREIDFCPTKNPYDPRWLLAGRPSPLCSTQWESGFFDRNSWSEIMSGWAKTVICGRARLGGIPCSVIAVETRTVEVQVPADPASLDSESKLISQAGQVWYPDSAYKTAQAINDFNREQLPLFIFANWRGFSGGMKDMFDQVLKFGAYIVDALRKYEQPVFVYIPPHAELRGGAWVVVDPSINSRYMEMYADSKSRGGVLEPEGIVEIKYREKDLLATIERCDPICQSLLVQLQTAADDNSDELRGELEAKLRARIDILLPIYHSVAVQFADLHDRPGRMLAKKVISKVVDWKQSRSVFYWRLRRRLAEEHVKQLITDQSFDQPLTNDRMNALLQHWFDSDVGNQQNQNWADDQITALWFENQIAQDQQQQSIVGQGLKQIQRQQAKKKIKTIFANCPGLLMETAVELVEQLDVEQANELVKLFTHRAKSPQI
ncbi:Acetyl-CoA carboxylase [Trichinella nativa]|uniref:Acetyl-CoA carboxylase n=1 Tax=Trichinella nativa TaxID=6335 RepID=A0A0V1LEH4_9BILA|nr:Acetyl-CoA carboxylase [Trichinella nativa]